MLTCNGQYYSTSEQFCSGKTIYDLCGGSSYNVSTEFCLNSVVTAKCGGKTFTQDLFCYKESILLNRCGGETYNPDEEICKDGEPVTLTKGTLFDSRNGIVYKTVTIGTQTWMAENLNYDDSVSTPNLKGGSWCYDNKDENCETYGRLYTWAAAMNLESK
ncbi:MAG: hypothetical protein HUK20_10340, partial [Fibrobacter sp.]|nr:hypothetical protein [Fibrobacter sp.]